MSMGRSGFMRRHGDRVAHKGYYDRQGKHFLLSEEEEDEIIDKRCGGCLVAFYRMSLASLTECVLSMRRGEALEDG